ncbi:MAG: hypothetical protein EHM28_14765 [Spirochaetaceae bacterium]|nr:MAG: hypothetical protein EHM28_14765 [Spirochaetaceae bacterium]
MVITTGRMLEIKTVNKICLDKLGAKQKQITGTSFKDLLPVRRDRYAFEQAVIQVKTLKSVYNLRMDISYGKKRISTLVNMSAIRDPFNDEAGYVIVLHDIEGRLRMETTLQSIERMRALGQLAAGIAHQINNYTNAIAGSTELLKDSLDDVAKTKPDMASESTSLVKLIRASVEKLTGLTQHLTSFARAQQPPVISAGSVNKVIQDILLLVENQANKKMAALESVLDENIPFIPFSPLHLEQALLNIIMNALDAVPSETGTVRVTTRRECENIIIEISDNGPGISEIVRDRLFEAFVTSKPAGVGTGLGLNIARNVVESLKGSIDVNTGNGGTTMTVRIPIKQETPSA